MFGPHAHRPTEPTAAPHSPGTGPRIAPTEESANRAVARLIPAQGAMVETDEVVHAEGGALAFAPAALPGDPRLDFCATDPDPPRPRFSGGEARALVAALGRNDARLRPAAPAVA